MKLYLKLYDKCDHSTAKYVWTFIYVVIDSDKVEYISGEPDSFWGMARIILRERSKEFPEYGKTISDIDEIRFLPEKGIIYLTEIPEKFISA